MADFLLYGAYGYTGELIAREAVRRGLQPLLAGRDAGRLAPLATELGLDHRAIALDDAGALEAALAEVPLVLHAAGPFARTAAPMVAGCLRTGTHYLDVTGEIAVYEALAARDEEARQAGVMLLPGVGFDVVPTDCLALYLKNRLPEAVHLELAFLNQSGVSRGTATTAIENLGQGGAVRRDGHLVRVPPAYRVREVDFGRGAVPAVSIPWGDVATAYRTTGIPNITVYAYFGRRAPLVMRLSRYLGWLLASAPVQALLKAWVQRQPPGPSAEQRATGRSFVWGAATDGAGRQVEARLTGPESYTLTVRAALAAVARVRGGEAVPGYQTPAGAFGEDFVLEVEGVQREA